MTGYVIYACKCLNIKLQLNYEYCLDDHERHRVEHSIELDNPPLRGWQFEVIKVNIQFMALIHCTSSKGWTTIHYQDITELQNERVIIHKGSIFNHEIKQVEKAHNYSHTFQVVLNLSLPVKPDLLEQEDETNKKLIQQKNNICHILNETIEILEKEKEEKIEEYIQEQRILLRAAKEKAKHESLALWKTIRDVSSREEQKEPILSIVNNHQTSAIFDDILDTDQDRDIDSANDATDVAGFKADHLTFKGNMFSSFDNLPQHPLANYPNDFSPDLEEDEGMFPLDEDMHASSSFSKILRLPREGTRKTSNSVPNLIFPSLPLTDDNKVFGKHLSSRDKSRFTGYDSTETDRALSSQFAPFRRKTVQDLSAFNGRVIPPHILTESTAANEKEALFGSLPSQRRSSSCRPVD
ncbi:hypothetical protein G6F56_004186 [Rhizopus delemar]|nr:hypothetical protein G6F56_004186 [Rhizopus delemar]